MEGLANRPCADPPFAAAPAGLPATVFFREAQKPFPRWMRLLKPGFRHCGLVVAVDRDVCVVLESSHWGLAVAPAPAAAAAEALDVLGATRTLPVQILHPWTLTCGPPMPLALFTCVELVKRALGIRDRRILTPYQLYLSLGGDPVRA